MSKMSRKGVAPRNGPRKILDCSKDRDEELSFFRDIRKHGNDRATSLLQLTSEEFEVNGNNGAKGAGLEFIAENGKNDYNWLKTPPATPLFPSLEMETYGQDMVVQREIPIMHNLSRFSGPDKGVKTGSNRATSPNSKAKVVQPGLKAQNGTPNGSLTDKKTMKNAPLTDQKLNHTQPDHKTKMNSVSHKESHSSRRLFDPPRGAGVVDTNTTFAPSNLTKNAGASESNTSIKPKTRGISPSVRPRVSAKFSGFSNETPSNLRTTNRPESATRGRPSSQNAPIPQKQADDNAKSRRQSCSPTVARGRNVVHSDGNTAATNASSSKVQLAGNRTQVLGSRMVDKFMNARISCSEERQSKIKLNSSMNDASWPVAGYEDGRAKIKLNGSLNESSGYGRLMSKSSLDMAIKHMEFQKDARKIRN